MKCSNCGFENKDNAKFCTKCGSSLVQVNVEKNASTKSNNSKYVIVALIVIIIILAGCMAYFALNMGSSNFQEDVDSQQSEDSQQNKSVDSSDSDDSDAKTERISSTQSKSKSWELIGSYTGSGSGSQTISVPAGDIRVELSAYPIKNYATNNLYVTGSNGQSGGVDWGPTSDVETRSDSFSYTSSSSETFTIDYYETVSWEVDFYRYQ